MKRSTKKKSPQSRPAAIAFGHATTGLDGLTDEEFLRRISWKKSTDARIKAAAREGKIETFVSRLLKSSLPSEGLRSQLAGSEFLSGKLQPTLCGLLESNGKPISRSRLYQKQLDELLSTSDNISAADDVHALLELLPRVASELDAELFFRFWRCTLTAASRFIERHPASSQDDPAVFADQQLHCEGELPWRIGLAFGDIKGAGKLKRAGRKVIRRELAARTDGDGTPHAKLLPRLGYWIASLIRSAEWGDRFSSPLWDDDSSMLFNDLLEQSLRLFRPDGTLALNRDCAGQPTTLFQAASRLAGSEFKITGQSFSSQTAQNGDRRRKNKSRTKVSIARMLERAKLKPYSQSDWAELACLRNNWSDECDSVVVDFSDKLPQLDMTASGKPLLDGRWDIQISCDGSEVPIEIDWTAICWNCDSDGDYVELQQTFADGARVERQIFLSRRDRFAIFADCLSGFKSDRLEYTSRLPLVDGLETHSDAPTRESVLKTTGVLTRVFPVGLPQNRVYSTPGACGVYGNDLVLKHVTRGGGLYAPIVLDWHPRRRHKPSQWRRLTVTEDGKILSGDVAAGFRVKVGSHHLIAYRRLDKSSEPRAVLGYQTCDESMLGLFNKRGNVSPLLMIE